jgi:hypothetical protein
MDDFSSTPTRSCLLVAGVEVAPEHSFDREEVTLTRSLCWKHGALFLDDSGTQVRMPVENCRECG